MTDEVQELGTMEERATRIGWNPEGKLSAEDFVHRAEERLDIARGTNKVLERQVARLEQSNRQLNETLEDLKGDMGRFVDFHKDAANRAYEKALRDAQDKQKTAFKDGDEDRFNTATAELDNLIQNHPVVTGKAEVKKDTKTKPESKTGNPDLDAWLATEPDALDNWLDKNPWYNEDPEMADYAEKVDKLLHRKHRLGIPQSAQLEKVTDAVKEKFPQYKAWANPARRGAVAVEGGGGSPPQTGGKTYADLPPEAKKLCDKWTGVDGKGEAGTMKGFTREAYVKDYKWDE